MTEQNERLENLLIEDEMKESYLSYAMSVIVSRALPDVRDGLKPSQRRVLVAMNDLGLGPRAKYRKCAKIAGDTSGNYHPHGEAVVYPTLVRMAQDFAMSLPLIDGQGNFGSIDGDEPASMRYTEARLAKAARALLDDIDEGTVEAAVSAFNEKLENFSPKMVAFQTIDVETLLFFKADPNDGSYSGTYYSNGDGNFSADVQVTAIQKETSDSRSTASNAQPAGRYQFSFDNYLPRSLSIKTNHDGNFFEVSMIYQAGVCDSSIKTID